MIIDKVKQEEIKRALGQKAATFIEDGMLVGLGTGTTADHFIQSLIQKCKEGLKIKCVSSSVKSLKEASLGGIPVVDMKEVTEIDLTIDGADEIDPKNRMIKGGGGALTREKIVATSSKKLLILVDESKLVKTLGHFGLPIEILPFGYLATIQKIERLGYVGNIRKTKENTFYITDNGNYIFDIHIPEEFPHPEMDHDKIINIPGVVETGFFFNLALKVMVGYLNGKIAFRN